VAVYSIVEGSILERLMSGKSNEITAAPSFFYLVMAESCFRRALTTRHTKGRGMLRDIGRRYLDKANASAAAARGNNRSAIRLSAA
jgi:hypothetical protein